MAHFAELDENNIVLRVVVINDDYEADGENWCNNFFGGTWKQTSYNATIRKHYAGIGYSYDEALDAFIESKPYDSWSLNNTTCKWEAPVEYPEVATDTDGNPTEFYTWDEPTTSWIEVTDVT
jgi:hypothetical protein